jgi:hypothetical protein
VSEILETSSQSSCLEWYLHLHGNSIGFLNVYYNKIGTGNPTLLQKFGGVIFEEEF